ncbi:two-component sensor histidine kinase [Helicobacter monodelphidis]|nr:two-component sensor histidine kinase [Helicobacter sp. 15-1451]
MRSLEELINQSYQIENEFIELKGLFEGVLELLPNALWVLDENGGLIYQNDESLKIKNLLPIICNIQEDSEVELEGSFYLIKVNKKMGKSIISATDITDEKRKERLISMGQISANLAHEIRNPIGSVTLLSSTLLKRVDVSVKPLVLEIKKAIWRVERIIKATLLFSKGIQPNKNRFHLKQLQDELGLAIGYYTYTKMIDFVFNFKPDSIIYGDIDLLGIVFQNFIFNAIDAIEEEEELSNGFVELFCYEQENGNRVFEIYDNGKAFENKNIIFEPFKSTKVKGNGLGLALSLRIIEAHNGNVEIIDGQQKGFRIILASEELCS